MAKYMHVEDNKDGSMTMKFDLGMGESTYVVPVDFNEFMRMMINSSLSESEPVQKLTSQAIEVPNTTEEIDNATET